MLNNFFLREDAGDGISGGAVVNSPNQHHEGNLLPDCPRKPLVGVPGGKSLLREPYYLVSAHSGQGASFLDAVGDKRIHSMRVFPLRGL